jgi:cytochrome c peroxidase
LSVIDAAAFVRGEVPGRRRVRLPGNGPRAVAVRGQEAWIGQYFSDDLSVVDLGEGDGAPVSVGLGSRGAWTEDQRGESLFNDARLCRGGWQSCASCHDNDARVDSLNWDLLNDGRGNYKNARSLVWAHRTPPAMSMGVRDSAEVAVRAGIRHILFSEQPEAVAAAMDTYLRSLAPAPSPHLVNGRLSEAAERGRRLFRDPQIGCARCHRSPHLTDLKAYDVGTLGKYDRPGDRFDTPALVELWRTAPYLHDGSAATLEAVLTTSNPDDRHGRTSQLSPEEIGELAAYLRSL